MKYLWLPLRAMSGRILAESIEVVSPRFEPSPVARACRSGAPWGMVMSIPAGPLVLCRGERRGVLSRSLKSAEDGVFGTLHFPL